MPSDVAAVFARYPVTLRERIGALRMLIFSVAARTPGVGELSEVLRWGQPGYVTAASKSGSLIRIDQIKDNASKYAMYFICHTDLVATFRERYGDAFEYEGDRCLIFDVDKKVPIEALEDCIAMALTYHQKRTSRLPS
jgi:hypothetical protein